MNSTHELYRPATGRRFGWLLLFLCLLAAPAASRAQATKGDQLSQAKEHYKAARFDEAIALLAPLSGDEALPKEDQKEVLRLLGRVYIAKSLKDEAREVMTKLVELEPPIVELNPDVEPFQLLKVYYDVRKDKTGFEVEKADPGVRTIAVLDFNNNSIHEHERFQPLSQGLSSSMILYMNGASNLKVVERERLQWLLQEIDLQQDASKFDPASAVRAGKLLGAHAVVMGHFIVANRRQIQMEARVIKVETGEMMVGGKVKGRPEDFDELLQQLSTQVAAALNANLSKAEITPRQQTKSLDAMISYSEGLNLLDRGEVRAAYEKFREALRYDPNYTRAQLKAESIEPQLASAQG